MSPSRDSNLLDQWLFEALTGIVEREQALLTNIGKRSGPWGQVFNPGHDFATLHMAEITRVLGHLRHGIPPEGISVANEHLLLNLVDTLLNRQGLRHPYYRPCYWICVTPEPLDGDAYIHCVVTYSTLVVALIHTVLLRGRVHPKTTTRAINSLLGFFLGFSRDRFPAHGHDLDLDYATYAEAFETGSLGLFLVEHASEVPSFFDVAEALVIEEAKNGPSRSAFLPQDPIQSFSPLGEFCLKALADAQRIGSRPKPVHSDKKVRASTGNRRSIS